MHSHTPLTWQESGTEHKALWQADNGARVPSRVHTVQQMDADTAYRLASAGTGLRPAQLLPHRPK